MRMATIKDIYDADTTGQSRSLNYRFTVDSLDDPLLLSLIELNKKQNKVWRNNCIKSRTISKSVYPHKVVTMSRGPRVAAVKRHLGINKLNDRIRRMFDQNLPRKYATSFDVYVQPDNAQWHKMNDWIESKIKDRKNWLKIKKLENDIFNIEYMDSIVGAGFKV